MANKSSLENFFNLLLKPLDIQQSRTVPPEIYDAIYNTSAAWVIDKVAELWPFDQSYVDLIEPFLRADVIQVRGGYVNLPTEYRNFLDMGALLSNSKTSACLECDEQEVQSPEILLRLYRKAIDLNKCVSQAIRIVDQSEWDYLTKDSFDFPSYSQPIAAFFGSKRLRICPADIATVEVRYIINEQMTRYGYLMQPDDSFIFNAATSIESQFPNSAFSKLYKPAMKLLGIYLRDQNIQAFSQQALNDVEFK